MQDAGCRMRAAWLVRGPIHVGLSLSYHGESLNFPANSACLAGYLSGRCLKLRLSRVQAEILGCGKPWPGGHSFLHPGAISEADSGPGSSASKTAGQTAKYPTCQAAATPLHAKYPRQRHRRNPTRETTREITREITRCS